MTERYMGSEALAEILRERQRQIEVEGWTPAHDDEHEDGALTQAAACYALAAAGHKGSIVTQFWPWQAAWWKPYSKRRDLVRAAALIVAEIERMDRHAATKRRVRK